MTQPPTPLTRSSPVLPVVRRAVGTLARLLVCAATATAATTATVAAAQAPATTSSTAAASRSGWIRTPPPVQSAPGAEEVPEVSAVWEVDGELFCDDTPTEAAPNAFTFDDGRRWSSTALDGPGLERGEPTVLTWGFMKDGTSIAGFAGEPTAPSNLIAFLDSIRGQGPGGSDLTQRPWFPVFERVFQQWSDRTGTRYVYEAADDQAPLTFANVPAGVVGVRADVRIGGHYIDGQSSSNVLAYNFYPNAGDMVLDTSNTSFYSGTANDSRAMRNALAHEHGHGLGIEHVCPVNGTKLMEPFVSTAFDGLQADDVLAGNRGYGDTLEPPAGNDSLAAATFVGALGEDGAASVGWVSVDGLTDTDVYAFSAAAGSLATISLTPTGSTYLSGSQSSTGACSAGTSFDTTRQSNLSLELLDTSGTSLAFVDAGGLGAAETLAGIALPDGAGTYFVAIAGGHDKAQMYRLDVGLQPGAAAVSLLQTGSDDPALEGASLWYTVRVASSGGPASGVVVTASLPPGVDFVETVGCAEDPNGAPSCSLGTIEAGMARSYFLRVLVAQGAGTLESGVSVTWSGGGPVSDAEITQTVAAPCVNGNVILDEGDSGRENAYLAVKSIEAGEGFTVGQDESVRFVSGQRIVLTPGFSVASGAVFRARTDDAVSCNG